MITGARPPSRIGVVKPCCIGDCVMALPTLDSIAAAFPEAELLLFVGNHSRPILESRGDRWQIRTIPDRIAPTAAARLALDTRAARVDLIVLLERSRLLHAALDMLASASVAPVAVVQPETRHESVAYLDVLRGLAIEPSVTRPMLSPSPAEEEAARQLLARWARPVILHPGGAENPGATMPDKRWPADRYAELARWLDAEGYDVIFTGGRGDRDLVERIIADARLPADRSQAGEVDLRMAAALAARAQVVVAGDTGMSHIAAAAAAPVVAIFGPTNPRRYQPLGDAVTVLAPDASWTLPDMDLRHTAGASLPSTAEVSLDAVIAACRAALGKWIVTT